MTCKTRKIDNDLQALAAHEIDQLTTKRQINEIKMSCRRKSQATDKQCPIKNQEASRCQPKESSFFQAGARINDNHQTLRSLSGALMALPNRSNTEDGY
jgi:hypothetical protein